MVDVEVEFKFFDGYLIFIIFLKEVNFIFFKICNNWN